MNKKHAKSPCCKARAVGHGPRRRECSVCGKTWTVRPKRRGRKRRRTTHASLLAYLRRERVPLSREKNSLSVSARSARLRKTRDAFLAHSSWHPIPEGPLILIADAIVRYTEGSWHTWFLFCVRARRGEDAVILPPVCGKGRETGRGWHTALSTVPPEVLSRIVALVSDGHGGLLAEAFWRGWLVQRCHVHLIRAIQARRSVRLMSQHRAEAIRIYALVRMVLTRRTKRGLTRVLSEIEEIGWTTPSRLLKKILLGFVRNADHYRTYLTHPELHLPTTSNTAESANALIQSLAQYARGFRTVASFTAWITALFKARGTIKCRGKNLQN